MNGLAARSSRSLPLDRRESTTLPLYPKALLNHFDGRLIISTGENEFREPKVVATPLRCGLTVAVALCGRMSCRINDRSVIDIAGPNVTLILSNAEHQREQIFAANTRLRYALIHIAPGLIEEKFGLDFQTLLAAGKRIAHEADPVFLAHPADEVVKALAARIMACPITGLARNIYVVGKALELVAIVLEQFLPQSQENRFDLPLRDRERVQKVREILIANYRKPASVPFLAQQAGLNTRKLNSDFRKAFGMTVHAFLQEHRLQKAYQQITETGLSVSEIAYDVGYQPAHFATIFRRRFGLAPTELR